ncbi:uncharacterized protein DS421_9g262620 [Arachis hypogaea]|nr:uncharacterized protein DS421_9g262620 [Arachis hypogaea]
MFDIHERNMAEQVMELSSEVGDVSGDGSVHSIFVQDDPPLAPPPIHVASPVDDIMTLPHSRWNVWVSRRHCSTNVVIRELSNTKFLKDTVLPNPAFLRYGTIASGGESV